MRPACLVGGSEGLIQGQGPIPSLQAADVQGSRKQRGIDTSSHPQEREHADTIPRLCVAVHAAKPLAL